MDVVRISFPYQFILLFANSEIGLIICGKDSAGHVVINNADSPWQATFSTDMADGDYCDVVNGYKNGIECTGIK